MANVKNGGLIKAREEKKEVEVKENAAFLSFKMLAGREDIKKRFQDMLGKKSAGFLSSVISVVQSKAELQKINGMSILAAASIAASLDLPVNPNLGFAWIVPYKGQAQFQIGAKGYVQLAQRTGLYKKLVVVTVFDGEIEVWDKFDEAIKYGKKNSDKVQGYYAYFELVNGFRKAVYWTKAEMQQHAERFSKSYKYGPWQTDFDKMGEKTALANMLKKWGPMSIEMQTAYSADNHVITEGEDGKAVVEETPEEKIAEADVIRDVDTETGEVIPPEASGEPRIF